MNIALAHFRSGETDGVSMEMDKWKAVLTRMGHRIVLLAGSEGMTNAHIIPELHYRNPLNAKIVYNAFDKLQDYDSEEQFTEDVLSFAGRMESKLIEFLDSEQIDLLVPFNIWSLGWSLPAGIAFTSAVKRTGVPCLGFHHNFYWEREKYQNPTCPSVVRWLEECFPPNMPGIRHAVTNRIAAEQLFKRRGIEPYVIPNVFDFNQPLWKSDEYNCKLRSQIGVRDEDIVILQATRVTERKAIELGIDIVSALQEELKRRQPEAPLLYNGRRLTENSRILYLLAGMPESAYEYTEKLRMKAEQLNVDLRFINPIIDYSRSYANGQNIYSLWDAYVIADFVTFPSIVEGWGNQLLEAFFARKPLMIFEYPVYKRDILGYGFHTVSLGSQYKTDPSGLAIIDRTKVKAAAVQMAELLTDADGYRSVIEHNFQIGKTHFSYESLTDCLSAITEEVIKC